MPLQRLKSFLTDTNGTVTIWNTVTMIAVLSIGGLAVDTSNAWRVKTLLQNTAEASALAAAIYIDDPAKARLNAIEFARKNMPYDIHGDVVRDQDIEFGIYDSETRTFHPTDQNPDAVRVVAGRTQDRSNVVSTYLLRIAGLNSLQVGRSAIAFPRWGGGESKACQGAKILASGQLNVGGQNTLVDGVCVHGGRGIRTTGGDFFDHTVKLSSENRLESIFGWVRAGSVDPNSITSQESKDLVLLPTLDYRFTEIWDENWTKTGTTYVGNEIPEMLRNPSGTVGIVRLDTPEWTVSNGELQENTVYLVSGNVVLPADITVQNVGIVTKGSIVSLGTAHMQNVMLFAEREIDFRGETVWGDRTTYCDSGTYNSYLLSKSFVSLGGTNTAESAAGDLSALLLQYGTNAGVGGLYAGILAEITSDFANSISSAHGVVAAAPIFIPGGAFTDTGGIYVETSSSYATLGGNMNISNVCDEELASFYEIAGFGSEQRVVGSTLRY